MDILQDMFMMQIIILKIVILRLIFLKDFNFNLMDNIQMNNIRNHIFNIFNLNYNVTQII